MAEQPILLSSFFLLAISLFPSTSRYAHALDLPSQFQQDPEHCAITNAALSVEATVTLGQDQSLLRAYRRAF